ncbi:hypothetical protein [Clostridium sp. chh4-2]|uniref:hypothetical protein n=1 Tax=Clostridium sp. chh4-2 TaxID=2067550 RepID=UPI0015E16BB9|nr:hypothetical protein [Clostridium sp. chh4-2]
MKTRVNKQYKDRVFRLIFQRKEDLLDLYNALNDSAYTNPEELVITTLEDAVYLNMKNDVSFLIGDVLNLYEHQSTSNPNMPIRGLFYLSDLYRIYIKHHDLDIYREPRLQLPFPQYFVFYNGTRKEPDRQELYLSSSFPDRGVKKPALECTAVMLNINRGNNQQLMERCGRLQEYSFFIAAIRDNLMAGMTIEEAVEQAVDLCIEREILSDILIQNRGDIVNTLLTEYNEEKYLNGLREYERSEGKTEGMAEAVLALLEDLGEVPEELRKTILSEADINTLKVYLKSASKAGSIDNFMKLF